MTLTAAVIAQLRPHRTAPRSPNGKTIGRGEGRARMCESGGRALNGQRRGERSGGGWWGLGRACSGNAVRERLRGGGDDHPLAGTAGLGAAAGAGAVRREQRPVAGARPTRGWSRVPSR